MYNKMKKTSLMLFLMTVCTVLVFPATIENSNKVHDDWEDHVALSKEGGTTRVARSTFGIQSFAIAVEPVVEAQMGNNMVTVSVQNYRGTAIVEIYGDKGSKVHFFEVYDMGMDVISLSGLGAGEYRIRLTLGDSIYSGTIYKGKYGNRK
jgi:hypothetical protein